MAVYKGKCPNCGGILLYQDDGITLECDSCGKQYSISDLNQQKNITLNKYKQTRKKTRTELENQDIEILDVNKLKNISIDEIIYKVQIALETNNYFKVYEYCDEILRRDPKNAQAYLYKMLANLDVPNKESLKDLGYEFDDNENYKLLMRFADDDLKQEINNYNISIKKSNLREENEYQYIEACKTIANSKYSESYFAAAERFKDLGDYKDSKNLYLECMSKAKEYKKKETIKNILKYAIPIFLAVIVIMSIGLSIHNKNQQYSYKYYDVSVLNKENVNHDEDYYNFLMSIKIKNNSNKNVKGFYGLMTIKDSLEQTIVQVDVQIQDNIISKDIFQQRLELSVSNMHGAGNKLWNLNYNNLKIYFRITSIQFEDGRFEIYDNSENKLIK